jgi:hypothetical protein
LKKEISRRRSEVNGWNGGSTMENGGGEAGLGGGDLEYDIVVHGSVDHVCLFSFFLPRLLLLTQDIVGRW